MSTRILLLILTLSVVPVTAAASCCNIASSAATPKCNADHNDQANRLFVKAATLIRVAEGQEKPLPTLESAQAHLKEIIEEQFCSNLAVQLISGQEIGNVSMAALEVRINASKPFDENACSSFCLVIRSALHISDPEVRDSILAGIARKQVRVHEFQGASETIGLISDGDERKRLRRYFSRAGVRAALRAARQGGKQ